MEGEMPTKLKPRRMPKLSQLRHKGAPTAYGIILVLIWVTFSWLQPQTAWGKFYVYIDEKGTPHYTNFQPNPRYRKYVPPKYAPANRLSSKKPNLPFAPEIWSTALRHGINPALVIAMVKTESDFCPDAVSHKGAQGLMQLMPETADRFRIEDAFDPNQNLEGGIRYLKHLLRLFRGNLPLALAAYNSGEQAVLRYGGIPPFPETRAYVQRVLSNYRALLSSTSGHPR